MGLILGPQRWSAVPWLSQTDLDEGRRALWEVEYARDIDKASCWSVSVYDKGAFGSTQVFLMLHAMRGNGNDGGTITLAISHTPRFDLYAKDSIALSVARQSNPRRYLDVDHWREDGA